VAPRWFFRLTPYFSYVENYIDADVIGSFNPYGGCLRQPAAVRQS
jgi:hypothetical protein